MPAGVTVEPHNRKGHKRQNVADAKRRQPKQHPGQQRPGVAAPGRGTLPGAQQGLEGYQIEKNSERRRQQLAVEEDEGRPQGCAQASNNTDARGELPRAETPHQHAGQRSENSLHKTRQYPIDATGQCPQKPEKIGVQWGLPVRTGRPAPGSVHCHGAGQVRIGLAINNGKIEKRTVSDLGQVDQPQNQGDNEEDHTP